MRGESIKMAFDSFIKLKDIDGESTDAKHQGWIEISDCNMEILQTVSTTQNRQGGSAMGNVATGWDRRKNCPA
jgi:type VI protein secretion system component Hcp